MVKNQPTFWIKLRRKLIVTFLTYSNTNGSWLPYVPTSDISATAIWLSTLYALNHGTNYVHW